MNPPGTTVVPEGIAERGRVFIHCLKKCNFEFFASELWNMFCI